MASYPTYDPNIWVGGISSKDYKSITSKKNNYPQPVARLPGRVRARLDVQGDLDAGRGQGRLLAERLVPLPVGLPDRRAAEGNYESRGASARSSFAPGDRGVLRHGLLQVRLRDVAARGRAAPEEGRQGPVHQDGQGVRPRQADRARPARARPTAGSPTGPGSRPTGRPPRTSTARKAKTGYPDVAKNDPQRAAYLLQLSKENCVDGWAYRGGDAANFAIGQGDTLVTPLQMARVYAAVANGGTLVTPHIGKAIISPERQAGPQHRAEAGRAASRSARRRSRWHAARAARASPSAAPATGRSSGPASRWTSPGRRQDRHRRGLRQADDLVVRHLRAGEQAAVRRRDDGQPGRHRLGHLRAVGRRDLQDAVRHQGPARSTWPRPSPPGGHPTDARCRVVRPDGTVVSARRPRRPAADRVPVVTAPDLPAPDLLAVPAGRRRAGDERRLPPRALHRRRRPGAAPGCCTATRRVRRLDWTLLLAVARPVRVIGGALVWSATRQAALDAGGDPHGVPARSTASTSASGWCSAWWPSVFDYRMLRAYAPVRLRAVDRAAWSRCSSPLGSTINGSHSWIVLPGGLLDPAVGVRQGRAGRRHGDAAGGEARRRGRPRATSTSCWRWPSPPYRSR